MYAKILANMVATSHQMNAKAEGDYIGPDGFLYCGKCHTKKETSVTIKGEDGNDVEFRPYTPCKCRKAEIEAENERERKQKEAVTIERLRSMSGIPDLYVNANFSSFKERTDNKAILHMIRRYVEKFDQMAEKGNGLLFHGSVGTGKTYAAACIGNELIQRCKSVFMTSTYTMLKLRDPDEEEAYMNRIRRCALLIIDDIGAERSTEFGRERVFGYIDARLGEKKPMILTTNLDFDRMLKPETTEEARIFDRLLKRSFPVVFSGPSWRRAEAKSNFNEMKALLEGDDD